MTVASPLIGTPLHRALQALQEAETHLIDDGRNDFGAAGRLLPAGNAVGEAISVVKAELNTRHRQMMTKKKAEPAKPAPATIELKMPGKGSPPVYFAKTRRGVMELMDWVAASLNDAGTGIVLINKEVFDRLSDAGFAKEVAALREAAREILTPAEADGD